MSRNQLIAIQLLMQHDPAEHYDSGEDGILPECRACRFHRPYAQDRTCVYRICPYASVHVSTQRPKRWMLAYVNPRSMRR